MHARYGRGRLSLTETPKPYASIFHWAYLRNTMKFSAIGMEGADYAALIIDGPDVLTRRSERIFGFQVSIPSAAALARETIMRRRRTYTSERIREGSISRFAIALCPIADSVTMGNVGVGFQRLDKANSCCTCPLRKRYKFSYCKTARH